MLCEACGKRPATVRLIQLVGQQKEERHLCELCAQGQPGGSFWSPGETVTAGDFLKLLFAASQQGGRQEACRCLRCGLTYEEFSHSGKFGCSQCFDAFGNRLEPMVRRLHGASRHNGKVPRRMGSSLQLKRHVQALRQRLEGHVEREEYEEAARLRDEIRRMEAQ